MSSGNDASDTILVAQDGSPAAQAAANVAIQIARAENMAIQGLYVVDEGLILNTYADYHAELGRSAEPATRSELAAWFEERGEAVLKLLAERCREAGVAVGTEMLAGGVPQLVRRGAEAAQLVAMGRRGHGHADDPTHLGQNFRAIAHQIRQSLLVGGDLERPVRKLLLAYNGGDYAQTALVWASRLQRTLPADVVTLVVQQTGGDPTDRWLGEAQAQLGHTEDADYRAVERSGRPASEIVTAAVEHDVDLIILGSYRHGTLIEWLVGSTIDQILRDTPVPVLIAQ